MKKILISTMVLMAVSISAQGRRANQSAAQIAYGIMPDAEKAQGDSFMLKAGYSRVIGEKGFLGKAEAFYQNYGVEYIDAQILPYQKIGISAQAGWSFENLSPFFLNIYLGGFAAHETVNEGENKDLLYQAEIPEKVKGMTYGINGGVEAELILYKNISLTVDYSQYYDLKSKFSETSYAVFGGLKFYFK